MKKFARIVVVVMIMVMIFPMGVSAKSFPYKDVTKKSVGKNAYNAITYVYKHKGYSGIIGKKANKLNPKKTVTRKEYLAMLVNFYGEKKVPITLADVRNGNKAATAKWACNKMVGVAKKGYGMNISWKSNNATLTRALASQYLYTFVRFDSAFKPRR